MREDYEPYFRQLMSRVTELGFASVKEEELRAEFLLHCGWKLTFECERYYGPMFSLFVVPPSSLSKRKRGYEVGLLMLVFEKLEGNKYGKPTIDAQIDFLVKEGDKLFSDPGMYEAEYSKLNDLQL
jgi:hypothetical protein